MEIAAQIDQGLQGRYPRGSPYVPLDKDKNSLIVGGGFMWMTEYEAARIFLDFDYVDWKDITKSFLTLSSATLVLSITFSEKIINHASAGTAERRAMLICWSALLSAVVLCGLGLVMLSVAANYAAIKVAVPSKEVVFLGQPYSFYSRLGTASVLAAGVSYTAALTAMAIAGWRASAWKSPHDQK